MAVFWLAGCALTPEPFEYHNDLDEKPGPGLFSGDKGGFVIIGEDSKLKNHKNHKDKAVPPSDNPVDPIE